MNNEWTVEARCPHGYSVRLPFDALGYIMKPSDESCSPHRPVTKTAHGVTVTSPDQPTLSRFAIWREQRKARKALKGAHEWPWD